MAADLLRAPKTSIFEQTQPGLAPAGPRRRSWDPFAFLRATHAPAAAPPPTEPPEALRERFRIEVPVTRHAGRCFLRPSFQMYNTAADLEALLEAVEELLG